jgi:hypothetical protein
MNARSVATTIGRSLRADVPVLAVVCLTLRAASLLRSCLSDDEAIYAVVAREMLSGHVLYRDVVDHKPPLIYLVYAFTQALGGAWGGMLFLHGMTIGVVLLTALLLGRIVRQFGGTGNSARAPFHAALLYVVFTTTLLPFDSLAANCELYMMLPLVGSVLLFLRGAEEPQWRVLVVAGALVGVATYFKYQGGIQLVVFGGQLAVVHRRHIGRTLLGCLAMVSGAALILGLGVAIMYVTGAADAAFFWFRFNLSYIKVGLEPLETLRRVAVRVSFVAVSAAFLWILGIGAAVRSARRGEEGANQGLARFAAVWLVASAFATTTGGRFFGHYFHQLTAPLAVLAAPAAAAMWRDRRRLAMFSVGVPAVGFFLVAVFYDQVVAAAGEPEPDYQRMARFIDAHANPRDSLAIWGNLPVLYFMAERPLGTRFVFSNYMSGLSPATRTQSDPLVDASPNIVPESWDMFEQDLATRMPRVFIDTSPGNVGAYGKFPPSRFPRLSAILARDYRAVGDVAGVRLYERVEANP